ncbi:MAG: DUF86 domain-containing protein [Chloroflexi bacterium]|nr:DUF86 domain-containing protein [Chloroflexota bacterium]
MRLETRKYLSDIQQAAGRVQRFTSGKTLADYQGDDLLRSAVERQFEIVGEAMNKLAGIDEGTARRITNFQRIIAFRNILIHGYADVDDNLVWNVVETYLPLLVNEINALLDE